MALLPKVYFQNFDVFLIFAIAFLSQSSNPGASSNTI